jgi:2,3-bisphosphoglycerate-independent phosphoglycerate mutase
MTAKKQVLLVILDGWGHQEEKEHNAIAEAKTPYFDYLWNNYPHATLEASGEAVGLPDGQMGNSEVGHTIIGAGKVVYTDFAKISKAARENEFEKNPSFIELFNHVKKYNSVLHIKGLIGPGGVHSHSQHLYAFLRTAKKAGITKVAIHAFADGRDTPPQSAHDYLKELEDVIEHTGIGFIATASGRFYAMDRDNNWDRLKKAEDAIFDGIGKKHQGHKPSEIIKDLHDKNIVDEHIEPIIFLDDLGNNYQVRDNDGIFFFNFRKDRARMMTQRIIERRTSQNLFLVTMTQYDKNFDCAIAFSPEKIETTLANEISKANLTQAHIAETEKFAHCTYYLNGGKQEPHIGEEQILIESRKDIDTHDQAPEMRAKEITEKVMQSIENKTDFIFVNYANPDMVGHTGNKSAIIKAIECIDSEIKKIVTASLKANVDVVITADHGNAEMIFDKVSNQNHTAHTINPVPVIYIGKDYSKISNGALYDIAPTILEILGIKKPEVMTGENILQK